MTFQEAIIFKKKLGKDLITNHDLTMRVFVTPANHDDFTKYITDFRGGYFVLKTSNLSCEFERILKVLEIKLHGVNVRKSLGNFRSIR